MARPSVADQLHYLRATDAPNMHWTALFVLERLIESGENHDAFKKRVGVAKSVFYHWRRSGVAPTMQTLEPCLKALGYQLAVVPLDEPVRNED